MGSESQLSRIYTAENLAYIGRIQHRNGITETGINYKPGQRVLPAPFAPAPK